MSYYFTIVKYNLSDARWIRGAAVRRALSALPEVRGSTRERQDKATRPAFMMLVCPALGCR
jgi:hypothetical protein